jgi:hypothetical protein
MRAELRSALAHVSAEALAAQHKEPTAPHELPEDFVVEYPQIRDLVCVGGVYLSQLLAQPAWQLRDPRGFLEALLLHWARLVDGGAEHAKLDEPSQSLVVLLQANPALAPHVAAMGYLSKLLSAVAAERADVQKAATQVMRVLSGATECVHAMRSLDSVTPLLKAMKEAP